MSDDQSKSLLEPRPLNAGDKRVYATNAAIAEAGDLVPTVVLAAQGRNPDGRIRPGHVNNPEGRPKSKPMKNMLLQYLKDNPSELRNIIVTAVEQAKAGNSKFWIAIRDMLDGKPVQMIAGPDEGPINIATVPALSDSALEALILADDIQS